MQISNKLSNNVMVHTEHKTSQNFRKVAYRSTLLYCGLIIYLHIVII